MQNDVDVFAWMVTAMVVLFGYMFMSAPWHIAKYQGTAEPVIDPNGASYDAMKIRIIMQTQGVSAQEAIRIYTRKEEE